MYTVFASSNPIKKESESAFSPVFCIDGTICFKKIRFSSSLVNIFKALINSDVIDGWEINVLTASTGSCSVVSLNEGDWVSE